MNYIPLTALIEAGHKDALETEQNQERSRDDTGSDADPANAGSNLNTLPSDLQ